MKRRFTAKYFKEPETTCKNCITVPFLEFQFSKNTKEIKFQDFTYLIFLSI